MPDYLCVDWTASGYSAALYAAPGSYGTILSFVEPAESGTTSAALYDVALDSCTPHIRGGIPDLRLSRVLGPLPALPDPWMGQQVAWFHGSSLGAAACYFTGDVVSYQDRYDGSLGWVREYRALGLRNRADWIPVTDSNTLTDNVRYNMPANNLNTIVSREGRTVGQAVLDLLSMSENQAWLGGVPAISPGYGIGNYTSQGYGGAGTAVLGTVIGSTNQQVASISVSSIGSGYTTAPTVVIAGPCTTQATAYATTDGSSITGFVVTYGGSGYLTTPAVIVSNLPTVTVDDCAALNVISCFTLAFAGERILSSVESVVQTCHPNHWVSVDPAGNIRILDQRQNTVHQIELGDPADPRWSMPAMTRDTSDTYSQVIVRGGPNVVGVTLGVKQWPGSSFTSTWAPSGSGAIPNGGLLPWFTFNGYTTNAAAEAVWAPAMYQTLSLQSGQDQGSCTCTDTLHVVLTSTQGPSYVSWTIDQLDQSNTGQHAILTFFSDTIPDVQQLFQARIVANTATTSAGTSGNSTAVTLDQPLPSVAYNSYRLYALSQAGNVVWRRYKVMNAAIAAQMQQFFPYPFAFAFPGSPAAVMTSAPVCNVFWSSSGSPPYNMSSIAVIIDPVAGTITTVSPTSLVYGSGTVTPPDDLQVFLPVANGALEVFSPAPGYFTGTSALIEGIERIKVVTVRDWTDYSLTSDMQQFANERLQSMCDVVLEGSIIYLGLATAFVAPGQAVQIAGSTYVTGWEGGGVSNPQIVTGGSGFSSVPAMTISGSGGGAALSGAITNGVLTSVWVSTRGSGYMGAVTVSVSGGASITLQSEALPVASMDVRFNPGPGGTSYVSTLHLSNRRALYTSELFVRPATRESTWGAGFGSALAQGTAKSMAAFLGEARANAADITGLQGEMAAAAGAQALPEPIKPIDATKPGAMERAKQLSRPRALEGPFAGLGGMAGIFAEAAAGGGGVAAIPDYMSDPEKLKDLRQQEREQAKQLAGPTPAQQREQNRADLAAARGPGLAEVRAAEDTRTPEEREAADVRAQDKVIRQEQRRNDIDNAQEAAKKRQDDRAANEGAASDVKQPGDF
ncbi:MAG: cell envelope integrity protein TolA [Streptosporangiaceae bacterium]